MPKAINEGFEAIRKKGSRVVAEGNPMLPAAGLMVATGTLSSVHDRKRPFVTVINSYTTQIPGHVHLNVLGEKVVNALKAKGCNVWYANIGAAICDGIAMGHFGMKYSLPSRELIADQIESIIGAHPCDAWIGIGNCDKIIPAMLNSMVRLNIPSVYVSGGPMLAGRNKSDLITVFEGVGKEAAGKISSDQLAEMANSACRTCRARSALSLAS
ncbi:MAG TPA: dihydroxy-acid dehydratase, partial [Candidatus Omnitrophota bacterium]|nr:dihydroxy-acid dehydratase [Candidatus Omnitrophota bacterium]